MGAGACVLFTRQLTAGVLSFLHSGRPKCHRIRSLFQPVSIVRRGCNRSHIHTGLSCIASTCHRLCRKSKD